MNVVVVGLAAVAAAAAAAAPHLAGSETRERRGEEC